MPALALLMRATENGWTVDLSNGRELIRYRGLSSRQLARATSAVMRLLYPQGSVPGEQFDRVHAIVHHLQKLAAWVSRTRWRACPPALGPTVSLITPIAKEDAPARTAQTN